MDKQSEGDQQIEGDIKRERRKYGQTKPNMQKGQKKERKKFSNNLANVLLCQTSANSALKAK